MPIMNKLPLGGGGNAGGGDGALNLYTQSTEPTKKDGIWVKTSTQYSKAIIDSFPVKVVL